MHGNETKRKNGKKWRKTAIAAGVSKTKSESLDLKIDQSELGGR